MRPTKSKGPAIIRRALVLIGGDGTTINWNIQNANSSSFAFSSQVGLWMPRAEGHA
jgi:hypothetical protein